MISCILIDDEEGALVILEEYIRRLGTVTLAAKFSNSLDAFHFLKTNRIDVMFLDINMPEVDGFGLIDMLTHPPKIIFTTAYSDHAFNAFEYGAIDYLHKPIRFERFVKALEKATGHLPAAGPEPWPENIVLKTNGRQETFAAKDIDYVESLGNYLKIHLSNQTHVVLMTMHELEGRLNGKLFIRIHKSYLVNMSSIKKTTNDSVLVGDTHLPLGKTYKKYVLERLKLNPLP